MAGVTPNLPVLVAAIWTPVLSMNALTPSTVTAPSCRLAVGVAVVPSDVQAAVLVKPLTSTMPAMLIAFT